MLYITTRSDSEAYTENHALHTNTAPDGGYFVPFCFPKFDRDDIISLQHKSYGEIIADILNKFFSVQLSGWDVDLCIGRNTARIESVGGKTFIAEMWHNPAGSLSFATDSLYKLIADPVEKEGATQWFQIAAQIAYMFALYGNLCSSGACIGGASIDLSVTATDMIVPLAACYARDMGLPIHNIIITSNENSVIWDLIHRGETNASGAELPIIVGIERLIHNRAGFSAVAQYVSAINNKRTYFVDEDKISSFGVGLFGVVLGPNRSQQIMSSFNRTNRYILEPNSALCVSGLQDYRAKTGENNRTLIISEVTPCNHIAEISAATGLSEQLILELIVRS